MKKIGLSGRTRLLSVACLLSSLLPGVAAAALTPKEEFGKKLFFDTRLSYPEGQSCAACHGANVGFTGPVNAVNAAGSVYPGAIPERFGNRKPPAAAYAGDSPLFHLDPDEGIFVGGMFWDGRATGKVTGDPLADQAMGPFLNPVEQNMPSEESVCRKVASGPYASLYRKAFQSSLDCTQIDTDGHLVAYKNFARAIAAFERSKNVSSFTSKYDYMKKGLVKFTAQEKLGMELFEGKGLCSACHPAPLFTDFTYDNLGVPKNPLNPFYGMDKVYVDGAPINPEGRRWIDPGLGGFLAGTEYAAFASENWGKHKVPTLRNVDRRPSWQFVKDYSHNGFFKSLEGIVHFYNTRDVKPDCGDTMTMSQAMKKGCWPKPEVFQNMNTDELGNLGMTPEEEQALVAFLKTLSDGYAPRGR